PATAGATSIALRPDGWPSLYFPPEQKLITITINPGGANEETVIMVNQPVVTALNTICPVVGLSLDHSAGEKIRADATQTLAILNYENARTSTVALAVGTKNFFFPTPQDRGQTIQFDPGIHNAAFAIIWNQVEHAEISWVLDTRPVTMSLSSPRCNSAG